MDLWRRMRMQQQHQCCWRREQREDHRRDRWRKAKAPAFAAAKTVSRASAVQPESAHAPPALRQLLSSDDVRLSECKPWDCISATPDR